MQERSASPSLGNIAAFIVVLLAALVVYPWAMRTFFPQPKIANAPAAEEKKDDNAGNQQKAEAARKPGEKKPAPAVGLKPSDEPIDQTALPKTPKPDVDAKSKKEAAMQAAPAVPKDNDKRRWVTLGSVDSAPENPYRMLITLSRQGGSVARLELSSERYRDLDDRSGYLGHLIMDKSDEAAGCTVQVVGPGTPAAKADIRPGDRITGATYRGKLRDIDNVNDLEAVLRATEPNETIDLTVQRGSDKPVTKTVALTRRPLEVIRPERQKPEINWKRNGLTDAVDPKDNCPSAFLTTLQKVDADDPDHRLRADEDPDAKFEDELARELPGVELRNAVWTIESLQKDEASGVATEAVFSCLVPKYHLTITKTYVLKPADPAANKAQDKEGYHLELSVAITNNDSLDHNVAFRQDGPNGLPVEGSWYVSTKVGRTWSGEGLRDVVFQFSDNDVGVVTCMQLSEKSDKPDKSDKFRRDIGESTTFTEHQPRFFGIDAQYFSVVMFPLASPEGQPAMPKIDRAMGLRVGDVEEQRKTLTNTTFRLLSEAVPIDHDGKPHEVGHYRIFVGPKQPVMLEKYQASGLICYGWPIFRMVAIPMTHVLEFFHSLVHNYGLAIIMLTIVVRLAMFPLSRKQALNAQMMQKLQPEIKEIQRKYKKEPEAARKAQQELFAKHNYNPLGGCLLLVIQMPIFLGLYRALQVDVELRDAPLISSALRWCSNLAAPDMLFDWSSFMPTAVTNGIGYPSFPLLGSMCGLGPYLNLFPIITLCLFILQQKVMMPPAADEQAATQQKMMKYMMVLMGLMFFKVAAGLCIYFIASTFWGLAERRFLPKAVPAGANGAAVSVSKVKPSQPRLTEAEREAIRRKRRKK